MQDVKTGKVLFMDGRHKDAARLFLDLAREGDSEAAFHYAFCLQFGFGVEKNEREAVSFYKFAKELIGEASYNLAVLYMHGVGVKRDYKKSYSYMLDAARANIIEAQLYLGVAHTMGSLFEPDIIAISLLPYHTSIGRDPSLVLTGDVPDEEADEEARIAAVRQDLVTAHEWFRTAALHDSTYVEELSKRSKYLYARCFVDGVGTDFNRETAEALMLLAANDGSPEAYLYIAENAPYRLGEIENVNVVEEAKMIMRLGKPE